MLLGIKKIPIFGLKINKFLNYSAIKLKYTNVKIIKQKNQADNNQTNFY